MIAILIVVLTAWFLLKKYNPQAVLLISGLLMLLLSMFLNNELFKIYVNNSNSDKINNEPNHQWN